jgi:propanol-preferring alcohol dehydrogenase
MAPLMLVPNARWLVPLGDLEPVAAAPLTDAGLTPYHAIKRSLPLLVPGTAVVVIGAGGLGHMGVQILEHLTSASVIVVDQRARALELAAECGAEHTVMAGDTAADEIRDLTGGRGAEVVIDFVGADSTLALGAAVVRPMGHLTIVGIAGGTLPIGFFSIAYEASVATTYWGTLPELVEVIAMARAGHIKAHVRTFGLDDARDAYHALEEGALDGRAVIVPS